MKLRAVGFSTNEKGDLLGTIIALSDDDNPLGFEDTGNFSSSRVRTMFRKRCAEETGEDPEVVRALLTQVLKRLREATTQAAVAEAEARGAEAKRAAEAEDRREREHGLPMIVVVGRKFSDITKEALLTLQLADREAPSTFVRGGVLVRIHQDEEHANLVAEDYTQAALKGRLDRVADFMKPNVKGELTPARPPNDVVADMLALPVFPFPPLRAIATAPVLVPDGRILERDGYDAASGVYVDLGDLSNIESMPLEQAREVLLKDLLGDFPFVDEGSRAHVLALLLLPFVRPYINGLTPLFLIHAPRQGVGKGLLAEVIAEVVLGQSAGVLTQSHSEEETQKQITALLLAAHGMIVLDNVRRLMSESLSAVLTTQWWKGRLLGKTRILHLTNDATWVATGNNVALNSELARRIIPIYLDPEVERPELRVGFRHPKLLRWAKKNRGRLVGACLSIIRDWLAAGAPEGDETLGRYEEWAAVTSGILAKAGVPGFLSNRDVCTPRRTARRLSGMLSARSGGKRTRKGASPPRICWTLRRKTSYSLTCGRAVARWRPNKNLATRSALGATVCMARTRFAQRGATAQPVARHTDLKKSILLEGLPKPLKTYLEKAHRRRQNP